MIEVNLMPRGVGRPTPGARSPPALSAPRGASLLQMATCVPGIAGLLVLAFLHPGNRDRLRAVETRIAQAVRDSTGFADLIVAAEQLSDRRDSVASRVEIIQQLDRGRYVWPHILDEVAFAIPEYTWLTRIAQVDMEPDQTVRIEGRAGNTFALTSYMSRLEASPFLHAVELVTTEQVAERQPDGGEWILNSFVVQVGYRSPGESAGGEPLSGRTEGHASPAEGQP